MQISLFTRTVVQLYFNKRQRVAKFPRNDSRRHVVVSQHMASAKRTCEGSELCYRNRLISQRNFSSVETGNNAGCNDNSRELKGPVSERTSWRTLVCDKPFKWSFTAAPPCWNSFPQLKLILKRIRHGKKSPFSLLFSYNVYITTKPLNGCETTSASLRKIWGRKNIHFGHR